jgi:hypothetical protein
MANKQEEKDRGPCRYPLKNHEAAKRTIARLVRDVIHGRIEPEKFRAAIYGINTLIQIFKIEAPIKLNTQFAGAFQYGMKTEKNTMEMTPEELQKAVDELIPGYEEYLLWAEDKKHREAIERNRVELPPEPKSLPEPEPEVEAIAKVEDAGTKWQPAGIGTRRLNK